VKEEVTEREFHMRNFIKLYSAGKVIRVTVTECERASGVGPWLAWVK
jgi:hypothetical protein